MVAVGVGVGVAVVVCPRKGGLNEAAEGRNRLNQEKRVMDHPYKLGTNVFVRTVTCYVVGRLVAVFDQELVLESASWVADTGRFSAAMATGKLSEVEPWPAGQVIIGRGAIVDVAEWRHDLPTKAV